MTTQVLHTELAMGHLEVALRSFVKSQAEVSRADDFVGGVLERHTLLLRV